MLEVLVGTRKFIAIEFFFDKNAVDLPIPQVNSCSDSSGSDIRFSFRFIGWDPDHRRDWDEIEHNDPDICQSIVTKVLETFARDEFFFDDDFVAEGHGVLSIEDIETLSPDLVFTQSFPLGFEAPLKFSS